LIRITNYLSWHYELLSSTLPAMPAAAPPPRDPLVDALVQTAFATMAVLTKAAADADLSLTQFRVMAILRDRRMRMSDLAEYLGLEKSTLSGLVDRAEKRGLLKREPNPQDGRAIDVLLAPAGVALAREVAPAVTTALAPLTAALTPAERRRLEELLARMLTGRPA
jgi:DNA-binding MarR family transcriptional regulator